MIGKESAASWARRNRYPTAQAKRVLILVRNVGPPSIHRRAAILMRDWGLEDEDISEMLALPVDAVRSVRANIDEVRKREPIPDSLERLAAEIERDDPPPDELAQRARECLARRPPHPSGSYGPRTPGVRQYSWDGGRCAFVPAGA